MLTPCASTLPCLPAAARHRWRVLAAGVVANVAFSAAANGLPMTALLLRSGYALSTTHLALVLGVMGLGIAISELPWGVLTDRWGDRPVLLLGLGGMALSLAATATWATPHGGRIPPLPWLGAGLLAAGLLGGSVNGASGRAIMGWFSAQERGLAMSIRQTAVPLGGALGAALLPWLAVRHGFATVFGALAGSCVLALALVWAWVREPQVPAAAATAAASASVLRNPAIWRLSLGIGLLCAPQFAVLSFGSVFAHDAGQISLGAMAAGMASLQIGAMVLRIWSGHWTDRHHNRRSYLRGCTLLSALLFAVLGLATLAGVQGLALLLILVGAGVAISAWHGVAYAELATLSGAARAGTALGLANTVVFAANFLTPQAIAQLLRSGPWGCVWMVASAVTLLTLPLVAQHPRSSVR